MLGDWEVFTLSILTTKITKKLKKSEKKTGNTYVTRHALQKKSSKCMMSKWQCELFLFRKDKLKPQACSIHVRARVRMSIVQLSCHMLNWKNLHPCSTADAC